MGAADGASPAVFAATAAPAAA